jgi:hypothetical protein
VARQGSNMKSISEIERSLLCTNKLGHVGG